MLTPQVRNRLEKQLVIHQFRNPKTTLLLALLGISLITHTVSGQDEEEKPSKGPRYGEPIVQRWQVGAEIRATGGPVMGLFVTIPIPTDWPEQKVELIDEDMSRNVGRVNYRILDDGVKQMLVTVPQVRPDQETKVLLTFEVSTSPVLAPEDTSIFQLPGRPPRDVLRYLSTSPYINPRHRSVKRLADEIVEGKEGGWETVEAIYDWVRDNVEYQNGELTGSVEALDARKGSGEDLVCVFIALCRANKIPARTVWVQGSYYAEFYLVDDEGEGYWFPCQVAGNREFGTMSDVRPVLQKGDNIDVPEMKEPQRYVPELVKGKRSAGRPSVRFVRELLAAER